MSNEYAVKKLKEAYHLYGYVRCTKCDTRVYLSGANSYEQAHEIAMSHHKQAHRGEQ